MSVNVSLIFHLEYSSPVVMITPLYICSFVKVFICILMVGFNRFYSGGVERVCEGGV